jgi:hypothetical protein
MKWIGVLCILSFALRASLAARSGLLRFTCSCARIERLIYGSYSKNANYSSKFSRWSMRSGAGNGTRIK